MTKEKDELSISNFVASKRLKKTLSKTDFITNRLLSLDKINELYNKLNKESKGKASFIDLLIASLNLDIQVKNLSNVPEKGGAILVANHPFGALDGIVLIHILKNIRPDVKVMATQLLGNIESIKDYFILVNNWSNKKADNIKPIKDSLKWVKDGHLLCVFPAGEVSHFDFKSKQIIDPKWNRQIAKIALKTKADVIPAYFHGSNSLVFQFAGIIHPVLRTIMLAREFLKKKSTLIELAIGKPIQNTRLAQFDDSDELSKYLRLKSYHLKNHFVEHSEKEQTSQFETELLPALPREKLEQDINHLFPHQRLLDYKNFSVYSAEAEQIPHVLHELGRLREESFRSVGEGTGKAIDLDEFDIWYKHLFVWDHEAKEILGAYRLGESDVILNKLGLSGLYTSTLFHFKKKFLKEKAPALELGRSFIQAKYQKKHYALFLLWKGICRFIIQNPKYRILFGPVSISNDYLDFSKMAIVEFLHTQKNKTLKAKSPYKAKIHSDFIEFCQRKKDSSIEELSTIVKDFEFNGTDIPVLLKHYLKLGGKVISFNVDKDFSDVLDAMIVLDMMDIPERTLGQYMGEMETKIYRSYHEAKAKNHAKKLSIASFHI